ELVHHRLRVAPADVARIRVLRHEAKRLLLAAAADHDRDARARDRLRRVQQPRRAIVLALVAALRSERLLEHPLRDLERLLEHLEPLAEPREGKAQALGFLLVPASAE